MDSSISLWRRGCAEALAAFAHVFAGCGAVVTDARYDGALGAVGISLVFGLVIMAMIYVTGHLSGAHINPAVTVAFTITRHFSARDAIVYVVAQCAGASAGALALLAVWIDKPARLGATVPSIGAGSAFVYELLLTAILMFVIMAVATDARAVGAAAAIAIGGAVGLDALFGGAVTGASMNPGAVVGTGPGVRHVDRLLGLCRWAGARRRGRGRGVPARARCERSTGRRRRGDHPVGGRVEQSGGVNSSASMQEVVP
jgi:aquaporin NIP